jgi:3-hydroxybutyrate dehydrogenase
MEIELRGRTALVSGAASGIGAACTEALAVAGAHVLALDLAGEALKKQAATLGSEPIVADLVNEADMMWLEPRLVHVDILVNNAGVQYVSPLEEFPAEKFLAMVALMLVAPFRLARAALP